MKQIKWIVLGWMLLSLTAQAASFDCAKAKAPQEILICFDYRLSDLDSRLAWTYAEALKQTKDSVALKQSQKDWLAKREQCKDAKCIMHTYIDRIAALSPGTNLEDLYFPKEDRPWEYLPEPESEISSLPELKGNNLIFGTYLIEDGVTTMTHGKDLMIPMGVNEDQIRDGNGNKPAKNQWSNILFPGMLNIVPRTIGNTKPVSESGKMVHLGDTRIAHVGTNYTGCEGGLKENGIYVERNLPWAHDGVLVSITERGWVPEHTAPSPVWGCTGEGDYLKFMPGHMEVLVLNDTLYLYGQGGGGTIKMDETEGRFVLRMNRNLQTGSALLGREIFLVWGADLEALTGVCDKLVDSSMGFKIYSTKHRACIDQQLQKLIGEIGQFYK